MEASSALEMLPRSVLLAARMRSAGWSARGGWDYNAEPTALSVMQWNLLAYGLSAESDDGGGANQGGFDCQEGALDWTRRRDALLREILKRRPTIMGCQGIKHGMLLRVISSGLNIVRVR